MIKGRRRAPLLVIGYSLFGGRRAAPDPEPEFLTPSTQYQIPVERGTVRGTRQGRQVRKETRELPANSANRRE